MSHLFVRDSEKDDACVLDSVFHDPSELNDHLGTLTIQTEKVETFGSAGKLEEVDELKERFLTTGVGVLRAGTVSLGLLNDVTETTDRLARG